METREFDVVLTPAHNGSYTAKVPALPNCTSYGETRKDALEQIVEAIRLHLDKDPDAGIGYRPAFNREYARVSIAI